MTDKTTNYEPENIQKLKVYFSDSRVSRIIKNVCWYGTIGQMLHVITTTDGEQAWPLLHIFNVRVLERSSNPKV